MPDTSKGLQMIVTHDKRVFRIGDRVVIGVVGGGIAERLAVVTGFISANVIRVKFTSDGQEQTLDSTFVHKRGL